MAGADYSPTTRDGFSKSAGDKGYGHDTTWTGWDLPWDDIQRIS
jgi:hypothetical protein